jgi:hypothetical protein
MKLGGRRQAHWPVGGGETITHAAPWGARRFGLGAMRDGNRLLSHRWRLLMREQPDPQGKESDWPWGKAPMALMMVIHPPGRQRGKHPD